MTVARLAKVLQRIYEEEQIRAPDDFLATLAAIDRIVSFIEERKRQVGDKTLVVGICGSQGSGKSTLARVVGEALNALAGRRVAVLSLDDLYLGSSERAQLARTVHPLLATRGVPGTHDVPLGMQVIEQLRGADDAAATVLPRFDKAADDRSPHPELFRGRADVVLFEGWCVGAIAQPHDQLRDPLNDLERREDASAIWRRYVNAQLEGPYVALFAAIDALLMLRAPSFDVVFEWRREQERKLAARLEVNGSDLRTMDENALRRFVMHFERLTRYMLAEMPSRADLVIELDEQRRIARIGGRPAHV